MAMEYSNVLTMTRRKLSTCILVVYLYSHLNCCHFYAAFRNVLKCFLLRRCNRTLLSYVFLQCSDVGLVSEVASSL